MTASEPTILEWLTQQSRFVRVGIGLLVCGAVACYIPHFIVAATGKWINNLTMWSVMGILISILAVQNLIGLALRSTWRVGIAFAIFYFLLFSFSIATQKQLSAWREWWMVLFVPQAASLLNGWLMERYARAVGVLQKLDKAPKSNPY